MKHACLLLTLLLAGCGATVPTIEYRERTPVKAGANVVKVCAPVDQPPGEGAPFGDVYNFASDLVGQYAECAERDRAKLDFIRSQGH